MRIPSTTPLLWFAAALIPMMVSQLVRLHQTEPMAWFFWDYIGRVGALAVLALIPSARAVAFKHERLAVSQWEAALRIILWLVLIDIALKWVGPVINAVIPGTKLGAYPAARGWLYAFDLVFGLVLVAYHEEIVFRRMARHAFQGWLGDGAAMVFVTSLVFAGYHWWSGIGNIMVAFMLGVLLMMAYRRFDALWPVVAAHYLIDMGAFV